MGSCPRDRNMPCRDWAAQHERGVESSLMACPRDRNMSCRGWTSTGEAWRAVSAVWWEQIDCLPPHQKTWPVIGVRR